jgi:hypothetical protein
MRNLLVTVAVLAAAAPVGTARAASSAGAGCDVAWSAADRGTAFLRGGPLAAAVVSDGSANPVTITLRCSLQHEDYPRSSGPDFLETSGTGVGVAVPPPAGFAVPDEGTTYVCGEATLTDSTGAVEREYYDAYLGYFTDDPDAWCSPVTLRQCEIGSARRDECGPTVRDVLDPAVCVLLAVAFPPDGDVPGAWDCAPRGDLR